MNNLAHEIVSKSEKMFVLFLSDQILKPQCIFFLFSL